MHWVYNLSRKKSLNSCISKSCRLQWFYVQNLLETYQENSNCPETSKITTELKKRDKKPEFPKDRVRSLPNPKQKKSDIKRENLLNNCCVYIVTQKHIFFSSVLFYIFFIFEQKIVSLQNSCSVRSDAHSFRSANKLFEVLKKIN